MISIDNVDLVDVRQYLMEIGEPSTRVAGINVDHRRQKIFVGINVNEYLGKEIGIEFNDWTEWIRNHRLKEIGI